MGTLDLAQRVSGNSDARTTPRTRLRLGANPQRAMASRTSYAAERQQHYEDGDRECGVERQPWNPCHSLEDYRRDQASKEKGPTYTPDDSVSPTKVFAHRLHGARFYSQSSAAQCSRQPEREARLDPKPSVADDRLEDTLDPGTAAIAVHFEATIKTAMPTTATNWISQPMRQFFHNANPASPSSDAAGIKTRTAPASAIAPASTLRGIRSAVMMTNTLTAAIGAANIRSSQATARFTGIM